MPLYEIHGKKPVIGEGTWIAPNAYLVGDVTVGRNCYIGFGAAIRGDFGVVVIGDGTAVEENAVIHSSDKIVIGSGVIIGHLAMIHCASVEDCTLIGMQATLCNNARVGGWTIVAEHSLVVNGQIIPPEKIYGGAPAKELGALGQRHRDYIIHGQKAYVKLANDFAGGLKIIG